MLVFNGLSAFPLTPVDEHDIDEGGLALDSTVTEIGSGLNGNRPRLRKLLSDAAATTIVVEHWDRLACFGVEYLDAVLVARSRR